jgi:hypothetical protein
MPTTQEFQHAIPNNVAAFLADLRLPADAWLQTPHERQAIIIDGSATLEELRLLFREMLVGPADIARSAAQQLRRINAVALAESTKSHRALVRKGTRLAAALRCLSDIEPLLVQAKNDHVRSRGEGGFGLFDSSGWVGQWSQRIADVLGAQLAMQVDALPPTRALFQQLETQTPKMVARLIVRQVFGDDISSRALGSGRLRRRNSRARIRRGHHRK